MKSYYLIFILLCNLHNVAFSQKETNIWYFGTNAGIDFNSGSPIDISPGPLTSQEGVSSICDTSGNILFFTDGNWVYDKSLAQMPNGFGLKGSESGTQTAIVTPHLGVEGQYYIFVLQTGGG